MCFNSSTEFYSFQLDEQWFNLHKDILKDALDITPTNDNNPFVAPPSSDIINEYVNTLGYPSTPRNVSTMSVNALYQPWRAILSMINMCLTGKTAGYDRPRHPVLQILYVGNDGREIFGMPIPDALLTDEIKGSPYYERTQGPARPMVIRKPDSRRIQPLLDLQGKGKKKVVDEQAAHDLLTLQTPNIKSPVDQFIFQKRTPMPTEASGPIESPSLDTELALTDSETKYDDVVRKINTRDQDEGQAGLNLGIQDEGQAGPNPGIQDEGQAGSNPGDAAKSQPQSSHVVYAGPNLKPMDLEATDDSPL
nr:hypothetical protein [Tanacetum cinerariifolium]